MFCTHCGNQIPYDDAEFCPNCGARIQDPPGGKGSKAPGPRRKKFNVTTVDVIVVIIIIAVISLAFVYMTFLKSTPGDSGGSGIARTAAMTPTPTQAPAALSSGNKPTPTEVPLPATGVWVRVEYLGSWNGSYGKAGALVSVIDSGVHRYEVENPSGTIQASFQKQDQTNHELIVEIYKNGVVIKRGTTTAPNGSVSVSADVPSTGSTGTRTSVPTTVPQKK